MIDVSAELRSLEPPRVALPRRLPWPLNRLAPPKVYTGRLLSYEQWLRYYGAYLRHEAGELTIAELGRLGFQMVRDMGLPARRIFALPQAVKEKVLQDFFFCHIVAHHPSAMTNGNGSPSRPRTAS